VKSGTCSSTKKDAAIERWDRGNEEVLAALGDHKLRHSECLALVVRVETTRGTRRTLTNDRLDAGCVGLQGWEATAHGLVRQGRATEEDTCLGVLAQLIC
jgi:hypothetical protein